MCEREERERERGERQKETKRERQRRGANAPFNPQTRRDKKRREGGTGEIRRDRFGGLSPFRERDVYSGI